MAKTSLFRCAAFALVALAAPGTAFAQNASPAPANQNQQAQQQVPAEKFIQDLGNQAISVIADKSLSDSQRRQKYGDLLKASFDMPTIGKFVLGRAWASATPQQQEEYMKLFEQMVIRIYGDRLNFYNGEGFQVTSFRPESDKDIIINSQITHPNGAPTSVDWRVRQDNGKMAVIDVTVEGISQSVTQRQEFASILQQNNGNIDALLDKMRQSIQQGPAAQTTTQ